MRIVVTRPAGQEEDLVLQLARLGHEVVHCPLIEIEALGDEPIEVAGYDWVVVTSANGARELRRRARGVMPRIAAIGAATAEAVGGADLVPAVSTQEGLLAELPRPAGRVLFAAGEGARRVLPDALGADVVVLYRTRELTTEAAPRCRPLRAGLGLDCESARRCPDGSGGRLDRTGDLAGGTGSGPGGRRGGGGALDRRDRRGRRDAGAGPPG